MTWISEDFHFLVGASFPHLFHGHLWTPLTTKSLSQTAQWSLCLAETLGWKFHFQVKQWFLTLCGSETFENLMQALALRENTHKNTYTKFLQCYEFHRPSEVQKWTPWGDRPPVKNPWVKDSCGKAFSFELQITQRNYYISVSLSMWLLIQRVRGLGSNGCAGMGGKPGCYTPGKRSEMVWRFSRWHWITGSLIQGTQGWETDQKGTRVSQRQASLTATFSLRLATCSDQNYSSSRYVQSSCHLVVMFGISSALTSRWKTRDLIRSWNKVHLAELQGCSKGWGWRDRWKRRMILQCSCVMHMKVPWELASFLADLGTLWFVMAKLPLTA